MLPLQTLTLLHNALQYSAAWRRTVMHGEMGEIHKLASQ